MDQTVKFKDEHLYRREMERLRQLDEDGEGHYESRILRGRMRLNAHPQDVQRDLDSQKNSKEQILLNSASKDESSIAYKKTALASGEFTIDESVENTEILNKEVNNSADELG